MSDIVFANWVSRILRWALALLFAWLAYSYKDARILYIFAGILFITGFFSPKRCVEGCSLPAQGQLQNK